MKMRTTNGGGMKKSFSGLRKSAVQQAARVALAGIQALADMNIGAGAATEVPLRFAAMKKRGRKARGSGR